MTIYPLVWAKAHEDPLTEKRCDDDSQTMFFRHSWNLKAQGLVPKGLARLKHRNA